MAELTEKVEEKEDKPATGESASLLSPTPLSGKMNQINYGGAVVEFPVEWDDNQVGSHLKRFRESPEFYDLVDMLVLQLVQLEVVKINWLL